MGYVISIDDYADVGKHWIALFCNRSEIVYFDSFGVEHIPEEITKFVRIRSIKANIFQVQCAATSALDSLTLCWQVKN